MRTGNSCQDHTLKERCVCLQRTTRPSRRRRTYLQLSSGVEFTQLFDGVGQMLSHGELFALLQRQNNQAVSITERLRRPRDCRDAFVGMKHQQANVTSNTQLAKLLPHTLSRALSISKRRF